MENKNENYKSTTNNCRNLAQMETADDIDRLCITGIVTDVCQHQIFRPGGKSDSGRIYRFITFVTAYGGNIFRNFIAIFGDQYCIECDTGDYRFSDDREKVYLIYGTDDRTELFSGRSDPGNTKTSSPGCAIFAASLIFRKGVCSVPFPLRTAFTST